MTLKDYQSLSVQSEPKHLTRGNEALLGLMGLNAASGEALGMYHKTLFEGVELDEKRLTEVLGLAIRHIAIVAHAADIELVDILKKDSEILSKAEVKDVPKEETV